MTTIQQYVWVFNGNNSSFPCAVFATENEGVSGTLTEYPVGISTYSHALQNGLFSPKNEKEKSTKFIETFSPRTKHTHWENGKS